MKKMILSAMVFVCAMTMNAQTIERIMDIEGGKVWVTSQEKLFSGCQLRMGRYEDGTDVVYGLILELTDRANHVCAGNLFTIHLKDGSRITLTNLWDTKADVEHEDYVETFNRTNTNFMFLYDAWDEAIYSVPVTTSYQERVPVHKTTSRATLSYIITEKQIQKIIDSNVKQVSIVTDEGTIVKKARPLSDAVSVLYEVVKK